MTKNEFEMLTIKDGGSITDCMYEHIKNFFYVDEHLFINEVYGGKVNTPNDILNKTIKHIKDSLKQCIKSDISDDVLFSYLDMLIEQDCISSAESD